MNNKFDINQFCEYLRQYESYKTEHEYEYKEWVAGGEIAEGCKKILDRIAEFLKLTIKSFKECDNRIFNVRASRGATYFPKSPWIGIFFERETATNGIYPILGFSKDSHRVFIGCVESTQHPQGDFSNTKCSRVAIKKEDEQALKSADVYDYAHIASKIHVFDISCGIGQDELKMALLDAIKIHDDFRKIGNNTNNDSHEASFIQEVIVDDFNKYLQILKMLNKTDGVEKNGECHWVYRGQGDSAWKLESSLGLTVHYGLDQIATGNEVRNAECAAMRNFSREVGKDLQFRNLTGVDLLALMQHYGCKTRLLDFTYSPLTAMWFAIKQNNDVTNVVRSYFKLHSNDLMSGSNDFAQKINEAAFDNVAVAIWAVNTNNLVYEGNGWDHGLEKSTDDADEILKTTGRYEFPTGVDVVRPRVNNMRISAQEGLFLMARNLNWSFEDNLRATLIKHSSNDVNKCNHSVCASTLSERQLHRCAVIKFVFDKNMKNEMNDFLNTMCISSRTIFPDLTGLAQSVTAKIAKRN